VSAAFFPHRPLVYGPGFLCARLLHEVVPNLGRGAVLAADRVAVDGGGRGHRRVAEAFADGREVDAFSSSRDAWLCRTVWSEAPLGSPSIRQSRETVSDTESGFSGVPSGFAMIRSRSLR